MWSPIRRRRSSRARARDFGARLVIGFGGSSMDVAKLVAVLCHGAQPLETMYGINQIQGGRLPLVQVPTTAGTGSEVTPISIVTTGETTKSGVVAPQLYADAAYLDAELTVGLPPAATAATGVDAMVHAIEAYTSKRLKNPLSDHLAVLALKLLGANLLTACRDGHDIQARSNMLLGAMLAGQAFANAPVGGVHALAYPVGGIFHVPHGLSNALVLPAVLRFNAQAAATLCGVGAGHRIAVHGGRRDRRGCLHRLSGRPDQRLATTARVARRRHRRGRPAGAGQRRHAAAAPADEQPLPIDEAQALGIYRAAY